MFIDYVTGQLGSSAEQQSAGKIARVVVAGNLIERVDDDGDDVAVYKKKGVDAKTVKSMAELDEMCVFHPACVDLPAAIDPGVSMSWSKCGPRGCAVLGDGRTHRKKSSRGIAWRCLCDHTDLALPSSLFPSSGWPT